MMFDTRDLVGGVMQLRVGPRAGRLAVITAIEQRDLGDGYEDLYLIGACPGRGPVKWNWKAVSVAPASTLPGVEP